MHYLLQAICGYGQGIITYSLRVLLYIYFVMQAHYVIHLYTIQSYFTSL